MLERCRESLVPKGLLILTTPYHGYIKNLALAIAGRMDRHFTVLWDGGHVKFFSPRTLRTMLDQASSNVNSIVGVGRAPWLWRSMVATALPKG